jgi:hypothetical protein
MAFLVFSWDSSSGEGRDDRKRRREQTCDERVCLTDGEGPCSVSV